MAVLFWLLVWQLAAMAANRTLLLPLPTPVDTLRALLALADTADFWRAAGLSLLRVCAGFALAALAGTLCAAASVRIFRANRPGRPRSQALRMRTVRRPQCSARNEKRSSAKNSVVSPVRSLRTSMRHRTRPGARREAAISPAIMPSFRTPAGSRSESAGSLLHRSTTNPASAASTGTQSAASAAPAWVKAKASAQQAAASSHSSQARSIRFRISF